METGTKGKQEAGNSSNQQSTLMVISTQRLKYNDELLDVFIALLFGF